jgi:hypothetical protein
MDTGVVARMMEKIYYNNLEIELERGKPQNGMVKIAVAYKDRKVLDKLIEDSIREETDSK